MKILRALALLAFFTAWAPLAATAQTSDGWPNRSVRIIVPFPAGGSTDIAARLVGGHLARSLGQPFVVDNRSGANGVIGMDAAAKSAADGYTVLVTADAVASNPHVNKVEHDPLKDLAPVIQLSRQPLVLAAHPSAGVTTLPELIALAKQQPGLRYATGSGYGSSQHMAGQWFAKLAGIEMEQVGYRGGGQAINDLVAGQVKFGCLGSTPLIPHYQAGKLHLLAQTTAARSSSLPNVPTFQEAGFVRACSRPVAGRVGASRNGSRHHRAAQLRDRQGPRRPCDQNEAAGGGARPSRRHCRGVRAACARGLREIRPVGQGAQHQDAVAMARRDAVCGSGLCAPEARTWMERARLIQVGLGKQASSGARFLRSIRARHRMGLLATTGAIHSAAAQLRQRSADFGFVQRRINLESAIEISDGGCELAYIHECHASIQMRLSELGMDGN